MPRFLHVGCGRKSKPQTTRGFNTADWEEIRLDIDPAAKPDIVANILDRSVIPDASIDAVFSSHNIEHLYPHEVPRALAEFRRVLAPNGFIVITCPDLQGLGTLIAEGRLEDPLYTSPAGPIAALDILYGHRPSLARNNQFMAHRCGFTLKTLMRALQQTGFKSMIGRRRAAPSLDLWVLATAEQSPREQLDALAASHFPPHPVKRNVRQPAESPN